MEFKLDEYATRTVRITPELAQEMLTYNTNNRKVSEATVNTYMDSMRRYEWEDNGQTIVFGKDGTLLDGQHRLIAIMRSGLSQTMVVCTGRSKSSHIDAHRPRSVADQLKIGCLMDFNSGVMASSNRGTFIACARLALIINNRIKPQQKVDPVITSRWLNQHKEAIDFCLELPFRTRNGVVRKGAIMLAIISAYEAGVSAGLIYDWAKVLESGFYDERWEISAQRLREYMLANRGATSTAQNIDLYYKAQNSLRWYSEQKIMERVSAKNCYPTPTIQE